MKMANMRANQDLGNTRDFGEHAAEDGNKRGFAKHATKGGNKRDFGKHATKVGTVKEFRKKDANFAIFLRNRKWE